MERLASIVLAIILFIIFFFILFFGARITFISSITLSSLLVIILLNCFYSPGRIFVEKQDFTLIIYILIQALILILLIVYILCKTLTDKVHKIDADVYSL